MVNKKEPTELKVGDLAPIFKLPDQNGDLVDISAFRGKSKVVLVFYPGDMTPGCTLQLCAIRDDWSKFLAADAKVFGVNHGDAESHSRFIEKHSFPFPLLVDEDKKVSVKYGAIRSMFGHKVIKRSVVGIDKNGKITFLKRGMPKDADIIKAMSNVKG